jgi:hypothetical protein
MLLEQEETWGALCQLKGWACQNCGCPPPESEKDIFFARGLCGHCAYKIDKLEQE